MANILNDPNYVSDRKGFIARIDPCNDVPSEVSGAWGTTNFQKIIADCLEKKDSLEYKRIEHKEQYVSAELISDNLGGLSLSKRFIEKNNLSVPWLINAPTGSGKSRFVLKELAEYAKKCNVPILVLSNRLALFEQIKRELDGEERHSYDEDIERHIYDNVVIYTYQSVIPRWKEIINTFQNCPPGFIVFDEVHYFISDASFNVDTEETFYRLMCGFPSATRIYMSATPDAIKNILSAFETWFAFCIYHPSVHIGVEGDDLPVPKACNFYWTHHFRICKKYSIIEHYFPPCYDNISLTFFMDWNHITDEILHGNSDAKWLIFVSSMKRGQELYKHIGKKRSDIISAGKKDSQVMQNLIAKESFEKKVLISTKVIDNGVNIKDDTLTNIVLDFFDDTDFIQMLGRKRRKPGEHINVYVRIPTKQDVNLLKSASQKKRDFLELLSVNPLLALASRWGTLEENDQKLVKISYWDGSAEIKANIFAMYQLRAQNTWYKKLREEMEYDLNAYRNYVCEWLGVSVDDTQLLDGLPASIQQDLERELSEIMGGEDSVAIPMKEAKDLERKIIEALHSVKIPLSWFKMNDSDGGNRTPANLRNFFENAHMPYTTYKRSNKLVIQRIQSTDD